MDSRISLVDINKTSIIINNVEFEICECIDKGGMSLVYTAKMGDSKVIIKELYPQGENCFVVRNEDGGLLFEKSELADWLKDSFKKEYDRMKIDNGTVEDMNPICFGNVNGTYYIVMSYLKGKTLSRYIEENDNITVDSILEIVINLSKVVNERFHSKNLVHLDIKPSNVWLLENTFNDKLIKILDYGCVTNNKTRPHILARSKGYSPYNIYKNGLAEFCYDTYAICGILYTMLTGKEFNSEDNIWDMDLDDELSKSKSFIAMPKTGREKLIKVIESGLSIHDLDRYKDIHILINDLELCRIYTRNQSYVESNFIGNNHCYKLINEKYWNSNSKITWFTTNNYSYAINVLIREIKEYDRKANISILKWNKDLDETLRHINQSNPVEKYKIEYCFNPLNLTNIPEKFFFLIFGIEEKIPVEQKYFSCENLQFLFLSEKIKEDLDVQEICCCQPDKIDCECNSEMTMIFDIIKNKGIRYKDLCNIAKKLVIRCDIKQQMEAGNIYEVNGYCYSKYQLTNNSPEKIKEYCESIIAYFQNVIKDSNELDKKYCTYLMKEPVLLCNDYVLGQRAHILVYNFLEEIYKVDISLVVDVVIDYFINNFSYSKVTLLRWLDEKVCEKKDLYNVLLYKLQDTGVASGFVSAIISEILKLHDDLFKRKRCSALVMFIYCNFIKYIDEFSRFSLEMYLNDNSNFETEERYQYYKNVMFNYLESRKKGVDEYTCIDELLCFRLIQYSDIKMLTKFSIVLVDKLGMLWFRFWRNILRFSKDTIIPMNVLINTSKELYNLLLNFGMDNDDVVDEIAEETIIHNGNLKNTGNLVIAQVFLLNNEYELAKKWIEKAMSKQHMIGIYKKSFGKKNIFYNVEKYVFGELIEGGKLPKKFQYLYNEMPNTIKIIQNGEISYSGSNLSNLKLYSVYKIYADILFELKDYFNSEKFYKLALSYYEKCKKYNFDFYKVLHDYKVGVAKEMLVCTLLDINNIELELKHKIHICSQLQ